MRQRKMRLSMILLGTFAMSGAGWLWASPTGSVTGFVKDPSGAVVVGATITLTNAATNAQLITRTGANGGYVFPQLPPATYFLVAEAAGITAGEWFLERKTAAARRLLGE